MNDCINEDEIKIEYYDSCDTDPLHEDVDTIPTEYYNHYVNIIPENGQKCQTSVHVEKMEQKRSLLSPIRAINEIDIHINASGEQKTWYKEIDGTGKLLCKFCNLTYSTVQTLRYHVKTKHPDDAKDLQYSIKNNKRNPKFKCHICNKKFKLITDLKNHTKMHFNCEISCHVCLANFDNQDQLKEHLLQIHNKRIYNNRYSCTICGYSTQKLSHFKQHKNTHTRNKQIKCSFCEYATNYLPNLKIHERIHTNYKPYVCNINNCEYALKSHQLKHNPNKNMIYCDQCTYKTVYKISLKKHLESHRINTLQNILI